MSKLPKIYHNDEKIISNNKSSYISYNDVTNREEKHFNIDENIYSLFNKNSLFVLKNGDKYEGVVISKRDNELLLNNGKRININDISSIN